MRRFLFLSSVLVAALLPTSPLLAREIHIPAEGTLSGHVVIADWFYEVTNKGERIPREFHAWPGDRGWKSADWFTARIEAHPGDVIVLASGLYRADVWVYTPYLTITSAPDAQTPAEIWGTLEIDADRLTLDGIAVTGGRKEGSSGHGIEINREIVNRMTIRNCRSENNDWTGIHLIGPRGDIQELRVENCQIIGNGLDGLDAQSVTSLIVRDCVITGNGSENPVGVGVRVGTYMGNVEIANCTISDNGMDGLSAKSATHLSVIGCTITGNGVENERGVGIRIEAKVDTVELTDNVVSGNRFANVYYDTT